VKLTFETTVEAYRALLLELPGFALQQNEHHIAYFLDGELVGQYLHEGVANGDPFDIERDAFDSEAGGWDGDEGDTRKFIDFPRYLSPRQVGLSFAAVVPRQVVDKAACVRRAKELNHKAIRYRMSRERHLIKEAADLFNRRDFIMRQARTA